MLGWLDTIVLTSGFKFELELTSFFVDDLLTTWVMTKPDLLTKEPACADDLSK